MHAAALPRRDLEAHDQDLPTLSKTEKIALMDTKMVQLRSGQVDMDDMTPEENEVFLAKASRQDVQAR